MSGGAAAPSHAARAGSMGISNAIFEFCMRHSDDPSKRSEGIPERDPKDYEWLRGALAEIKSEAERMESCLKILREEGADEGSKACALEEIQYYVEDLDNALDLLKSLKGGPVVMGLCGKGTPPAIRDAALQVVCTCTQNNPRAQKLLAEEGALELLAHQLVEPGMPGVRLFGALSGLVRGYPDIENAFHKARGPAGVVAALLSVQDDARACKKGLFFLNALWGNREDDAAPLPPPPLTQELCGLLCRALHGDDEDFREMASVYLVHACADPRCAEMARAGGAAARVAELLREPAAPLDGVLEGGVPEGVDAARAAYERLAAVLAAQTQAGK